MKYFASALVGAVLAGLVIFSGAVAGPGPNPGTPGTGGDGKNVFSGIYHAAQWIRPTIYVPVGVDKFICGFATSTQGRFYRQYTWNEGNDDQWRGFGCPVDRAHKICKAAGFAHAHQASANWEYVTILDDKIFCTARPGFDVDPRN
ncbi:MAG: hypothetical protein R8J41_00365 [Alphaproteobacteria bacterium]|nr:hypothetical protein [Alphaproteobacteria bacterium]